MCWIWNCFDYCTLFLPVCVSASEVGHSHSSALIHWGQSFPLVLSLVVCWVSLSLLSLPTTSPYLSPAGWWYCSVLISYFPCWGLTFSWVEQFISCIYRTFCRHFWVPYFPQFPALFYSSHTLTYASSNSHPVGVQILLVFSAFRECYSSIYYSLLEVTG